VDGLGVGHLDPADGHRVQPPVRPRRRARQHGLRLDGIWWFAGARKRFTGPVRNIEFDEAMGIVEEEDETTEPGTAPTAAG
jgi:hypothetical protein